MVPDGYFGPHATVEYRTITGSTGDELHASADTDSIPNFAGGSAWAWVRPTYEFNIVYWTTGGPGGEYCEVEVDGPQAAVASYVVHLPQWTPPAGVHTELVEWWNKEHLDTLAHELHHIEIHEWAVAEMNKVAVPGANCDTVDVAIDQLIAQADRVNCEFDVAEYGAEVGATVEDCLAHQD